MRSVVAVALSVLVGCTGSGNYHPPGPTPTPTPIVTPTPTPTPGPTPWPAETPLPRFKRIVSDKEITGGQGVSDCRGEGNCVAGLVALPRLQFGLQSNVPTLGSTIVEIYRKGGSENIPWSVATANWVAGGARAAAARLEILEASRELATGKLHAKEIYSAGYYDINLGNWLTIRDYAAERGDADVVKAMDDLLGPAWNQLTLLTTKETCILDVAYHRTEPQKRGLRGTVLGDDGEDLSFFGEPVPQVRAADAIDKDIIHRTPIVKSRGKCVAAAADRGYVNTYPGGGGGLRVRVPWALGMPTEWDYSLDGNGVHSSRAWGGPIVAMDVPYDRQTGKAFLSRAIPPARDFGIDPEWRWVLRDYVESDGTRQLDRILERLKGVELGCHLLIRRTRIAVGNNEWIGGVSAAFVTDIEGQKVRACSSAKGGTWVAVECHGGTCTWLSRAARQNDQGAVWVWWQGNEFCAENPEAGLGAWCILMAPGEHVSTLYWRQGGEVRQIQ